MMGFDLDVEVYVEVNFYLSFEEGIDTGTKSNNSAWLR
jgi:hypothetical protein